MLSYVSVGTNDLDRATKFYNLLFKELGGERVFDAENGQFYSFSEGSLFSVLKPADGQAATNGNGTMFSFKVDSPERVTQVYKLALELGASDEGKPGPRGDRGFVGSYIRDLDGNKLCIYHMKGNGTLAVYAAYNKTGLDNAGCTVCLYFALPENVWA